MIYIVGHTFTFESNANTCIHTPSLQQRNVKLRGMKIDERFISGEKYRLSKIKRADNKIQYIFDCISNDVTEAIEILFNSTSEGDEYIANLSGEIFEFNAQKKAIKLSYNQ